MILQEKFTLSNGVEIPKLGLGTWFIDDNSVVQAVKDAVNIGYRHIDTAQAYQNEAGVGEGIRSCGVDRSELFVTTKLAAEVITNTPDELIRYCQDNDILVEAYSPVGHGELLKNEQVLAVADKYQVSVPQLGIRYDLQLGLLPLPKTANPKHMKLNAEVDFVISDEDMAYLKDLEPIEHYGEASKFPVYSKK